MEYRSTIGKRALIVTLDLNETVDQLSMALILTCVREDVYVFGMVLRLEVADQGKKVAKDMAGAG